MALRCAQTRDCEYLVAMASNLRVLFFMFFSYLHKKLLGTSASLLVTSALLVVTRSY